MKIKVIAESSIPSSPTGLMYIDAAKEVGFSYDFIPAIQEYMCPENERDMELQNLEDLFDLASNFAGVEVRLFPDPRVVLKFED